MRMSRSGSGNGSGFSSTPSTTAKIATLAARHRASVAMVVSEKLRSFQRRRAPKRRSCSSRSIRTVYGANNWQVPQLVKGSGTFTWRFDAESAQTWPTRSQLLPSARSAAGIIPFLFLLYIVAYLDRVNVGFAAIDMNRDLGFSAAVYGLGSGLFFLSYTLLEVPEQLDAGQARRPRLDCPHHVHVGRDVDRDDVRRTARSPSISCASCWARRRPGSFPA